jgi:lipoic acid synthetase
MSAPIDQNVLSRPKKLEAGKKLSAAEKMARIPVKIEPTVQALRKPDWIRIKLPLGNKVDKLKEKLRANNLVTVCEEASCPNLSECFTKGTATFMIMGDICTRRCSFCDVAHGRPNALDPDEPQNLAKTIMDMGLKYVVITSVDRDDLLDGGAQHFVDCISAIRKLTPDVKIEVLVPDFRGRLDKALSITQNALPDVFNHNLETVPRIYRKVRPGSDYQHSLNLLGSFKAQNQGITTKSGIMVGIEETFAEVVEVMKDLRNSDVDMLTVGQYLQPSKHHLPVTRYWTPEEFKQIEEQGYAMGFKHVASGPLVRSSYHADLQAENKFSDLA